MESLDTASKQPEVNSHSPVQEGNESKVFCTDPSGQMRIVAPVATFLLEYLWEAEQKGEEWGGQKDRGKWELTQDV